MYIETSKCITYVAHLTMYYMIEIHVSEYLTIPMQLNVSNPFTMMQNMSLLP